MNPARCVFQKFVFPSLRHPLSSWHYCPAGPLLLFSKISMRSFTSVREKELRMLLSACGRERNLRLGSSLHACIIKTPPFFHLGDPPSSNRGIVLYNCLLHVYCECGEVHYAAKLFGDMPFRDTISWNSIISGFLRQGKLIVGFGYFKLLLASTICQFDHASLTVVLSACGGLGSVITLKMIHALAIYSGYEKEMTVGNALTTSYFKCQAFESAMFVFYEMVEKNVVSWTASISGLAQNGFYSESLLLFVQMHHSMVSPNCLTFLAAISACSGLQAMKEGAQIHGVVWKLGIQSDICIESALMDMYSRCGCVDEVMQIFESAEVLDEVSLTVILVCLAQNGFEEEAVQMFVKIVNAGTDVDPNMVSAILGVVGMESSLGLGSQVHCLALKRGFGCNIFISNGLINMYSKFGELEESVKVFHWMAQRNEVSWNSMIAAFARHGNGIEALDLYEKMRFEGVGPTDITFLSLLHACSHVGLPYKGMKFLESMERTYGMRPRMEHYACIVDMLGRAGLLKEAKNFIEGLPVRPDALVWQALLGACGICGDTDMGEYAAGQLALMTPDSPVPYVSMANIYSSKGRWEERARTIKKMKEKGVAKETGTSWIEIDKKVHRFVVAEQMHPQGDDIYVVLLKLFGHMKAEDDTLDGILVSSFSNQQGVYDSFMS